ncbi:putative exocyst complex component Sec10 [Trypanosoma cruzi]|nr:putative exocyst complex component Sec10 [Trypanosoma cruzi]
MPGGAGDTRASPVQKKIVVRRGAGTARKTLQAFPPSLAATSGSGGGGGGVDRLDDVNSGVNTSTGRQRNADPPSPTSSPTQQRPRLDRMVFSSVQFSAPAFVNSITNRVLLPILLSRRKDASPAAKSTTATTGAAAGGAGRPWQQFTESGDSDGLQNSVLDGTRLFHEDAAAVAAEEDHVAIASHLTTTLESALAEIEMVQEEEERSLQSKEVRCRRVEIREKRQLATIRLGLEATTARLHEYENRVCNALAATAGIEQHLSQSNARMMRGRSVSQLLKHFKMFTQMNHSELNALLKNLSKARAEQRGNVTSQWEVGLVSPADPMYFGGSSGGAGGGVGGGTAGGDSGGGGEDGAAARSEEGESGGQEDVDDRNNPNRKDGAELHPGTGDAPNGGGRNDGSYSGSSRADADRPRGILKQGGPRQLRRRVGTMAQDSVEASAWTATTTTTATKSGGGGGVGSREKMHRIETAAVAAGLDRIFVMRSCTEAQVEWCQRLTHLCRELNSVVRNTSNIQLYVEWVRQELMADIFHLVDCFNELYKEHPATAVHQPYGRAILKTLELVSRLYTSITDSHDALLFAFYSRTINQMGITLFSEYSPKPLPPQPPLSGETTTSAPLSAMQHYRRTTEPDLQRTFDFLISRARRDVIVVETIFGTTSTARQQLLAQVTEGVVKPFVTQQLKLVEFFERDMVEAESRLSPRSKRRASARVADAMTYSHTMQARVFSFFQDYVKELRNTFEKGEVDFLNKYVDSIFTGRAAFVEQKAELALLKRYHTMLEEQYTRDLHSLPDEVFDLREAHMKKTKELVECLTEVVARTRIYAPPKDVTVCVLDLIRESLENMGNYMDEEVRKMVESLRADREHWRMKPESEEELLRPTKLESQQCGLRMLLFVQSSLMILNDAITSSCMPLLQSDPRLESAIEEAKESAYEALDERAETLLNLCANAIIVRSLSILVHYQNRNDYKPRVAKGAEGEMLAQPCTRACTLFCLYITRQFDEAKEFIRLSNGQVPQRQHAFGMATGAKPDSSSVASLYTTGSKQRSGSTAGNVSNDVFNAVRARARTMNMQQLLYGDGGPSSFVRTVGVCLYRGIVTHLKAFTVTDRGALIYKQDVTAYMEAMGPVIRTPGLGGAVVEVLFRLLKETASLLLMPWGHIKSIRETGLLRLMSNEEKVQFIRMREDLQEGFRKIDH